MTAAALDERSVPANDRVEERRAAWRWAGSFAAVIGLHAVAILICAWWLGPVERIPAPPPEAVMVDMAPIPVAPEAAPTDIPPGPQQTAAAAQPQPPTPRDQPIPIPDQPPARKADVPVPPKPKSPLRRQKIVPHQDVPPKDLPPAPATTAPPATVAPPAPTPAAPASGANPVASNSAPTWQGLLLGRLEEVKRYPPLSQMRNQQGVAYLRFTMDRNGKVLSAKIEKRSGYDLLDEETLALIKRAEPLPKPPADVGGDTLELVVPIEFFLSGRR